MSKISLKHSGGNVVSLNSPTSAPTSADVAFKLPNADGTNGQRIVTDGSGNLSFASAGASGKILQVVSGSQQVAASQGFSSDAFVDTGLSASITPSSSSSKVFVTGYLTWRFEMSQNGNAQWNFAITDGSNNILDATTNDLDGYEQDDAGSVMGRKHPISFLHSPNTTNSFTYKMRMNAKNSQYSANLIVQKNGTANNISRIILMEVAA